MAMATDQRVEAPTGPGAGGGLFAGVAILGAAYGLSQFFRSILPVLYPDMNDAIGLDPGGASAAASAYFYAFALAQLPVGWALDRIGPRLTTGVSFTFGCGGGALLFASADRVEHVVWAMGLIGLGCAPALMASLYIYARRFDPTRFATYSALLIGLSTLVGNVGAAQPLASVVGAVGWRPAMVGVAVASMAVGLAVLALVRDPERMRSEDGQGAIAGLSRIVRTSALWWMVPLLFVNYATVANIRGAWAGPYLATTFGYDADAIGAATLSIALAMVVGTLAYGPLDRIVGGQKWVVFAGLASLTAACAGLAAAPSSSPLIATLLLTAVGLFGVAFPALIAHGRRFLPPDLIGRGVTLLNFVSMMGTAISQNASAWAFEAAEAAGSNGFGAVFAFYAAATGVALIVYLGAPSAPSAPNDQRVGTGSPLR